MNSFSKTFLSIILSAFYVTSSMACAGGDDSDWSYYNLFMQEIIDDPVYYPFLLTYMSPFYSTGQQNVPLIKNENIEQWQNFLKVDYDKAYYLVYEAKKNDLELLLKGEKTTDDKLSFISPAFAKKHKQAIEYLVYAKELEPYMSIITSGDSWYYYTNEITVADLDYDAVVAELEKRYKSVKNKELKLRYGYQLVRLAHYSRKYEKSIEYFNTHVEPLKIKPAIYYHALSQMAGAEKGLGNINTANYIFLQVFVHSKNLKESAYLSIKLGDFNDWDELLKMAKNENERNDAYLLLGYNNFSNPLNEITKIAETSPDAIQAKVLMTRAINSIERAMMPVYYYYYGQNISASGDNKFYPMFESGEYDYIPATLKVAESVVSKSKDKNFWLITTAYLHFLNKDFDEAKVYLDQVTATNEKYTLQKRNLAMLIDICRNYTITPELEEYFYTQYDNMRVEGDEEINSNTHNFIIDVLANRYYMQGDYAKSFLMNNRLTTIKDYPQPELLAALERFYHKPNKNGFEKFIAQNLGSNPQSQFNYIWGIVHLSNGDVKKANKVFEEASQHKAVTKYIFGVNISECFDCDEETMMQTRYLSEFPYIDSEMSWYELTSALLKLIDEGNKKSKLSAKANYLVGNFFYNVSSLGYYRHLLRFNYDNSNSSKYYIWDKPDISNLIYFKYYPSYYKDNVALPNQYLVKAYRQADNDDLRSRIVFSLSKWEQGKFNHDNQIGNSYWGDSDPLITDRKYFKELMKYQNTKYFGEVQSKCKYFDYYVSVSSNR